MSDSVTIIDGVTIGDTTTQGEPPKKILPKVLK